MLQIFDVEASGPETTVCVVRCVGGRVRTGDRFEDGALVLDRIELYGREVPELTPPLSAKARLSGAGVRVLRPRIVIASAGPRRYGYVGPPEIRAAVAEGSSGRVMRTPEDFTAWVADQAARDLDEPFTYVVDEDGFLRLAPSRRATAPAPTPGPPWPPPSSAWGSPTRDGSATRSCSGAARRAGS
ncbi:hypothetical protein ABZX98_06555 [Streptomyces sp. NPDC002992]|uniref:hypothetical protein n=1 Tax=Streptomyces sp. NPDC002992 TaxID=3154273 RepID=UPI0033A96BB5